MHARHAKNNKYHSLLQVFAVDTTQTVDMIRRFILQREIVARFIKINILNYIGGPCLKMEILGCPKRSKLPISLAAPCEKNIYLGLFVTYCRPTE